ncbi:hypothetical protein THTE_2000 [Thermogutta terrifontis]|uniref:Uncharacterized protein n=1 Tax=Thermogutta terrifontis TaxID=1331910 RepID=A0A286RF87_9BACT|nr:hypothetical protein THTE_2000 [Thermogutta terrifontis]
MAEPLRKTQNVFAVQKLFKGLSLNRGVGKDCYGVSPIGLQGSMYLS